MSFIHDDFLLSNDAAVRLYHDYAAQQPIIDYHNHLSPKDIATNRRFENLFEMWVNHDHYKWRAMRANGIPERLVTGDGDPKEKFFAFAATVPYTLRNPIYHWTHLELKRFFDIDELLCEANAEAIWNECNQQIQSRDELTTQGILKKFNVTALCTTDDPVDSLEYHQQVAQTDFETKVYPAFRPDWALFVHRPEEFIEWLSKLSQAAGIPVETLDDLLAALRIRHDFFHSLGCRLSDHGCESVPANFCNVSTARKIFDAAKAGVAATAEQHEQYSTFMLIELCLLYTSPSPRDRG